MAYGPSKTSALQTAVNAAVTLVAAEVGAGLIPDQQAAMARYDEVKDKLRDELFAQVDAEVSSSPPRQSFGTQQRSSKPFSVEDARGTVLNFGAFKGLTLGDVEKLTAEEAEGYGYKDKDGKGKPGIQWIRWAAGNTEPKAAFIRARAQAIVDDLGLVPVVPGDVHRTLNAIAQ